MGDVWGAVDEAKSVVAVEVFRDMHGHQFRTSDRTVVSRNWNCHRGLLGKGYTREKI